MSALRGVISGANDTPRAAALRGSRSARAEVAAEAAAAPRKRRLLLVLRPAGTDTAEAQSTEAAGDASKAPGAPNKVEKHIARAISRHRKWAPSAVVVPGGDSAAAAYARLAEASAPVASARLLKSDDATADVTADTASRSLLAALASLSAASAAETAPPSADLPTALLCGIPSEAPTGLDTLLDGREQPSCVQVVMLKSSSRSWEGALEAGAPWRVRRIRRWADKAVKVDTKASKAIKVKSAKDGQPALRRGAAAQGGDELADKAALSAAVMAAPAPAKGAKIPRGKKAEEGVPLTMGEGAAVDLAGAASVPEGAPKPSKRSSKKGAAPALPLAQAAEHTSQAAPAAALEAAGLQKEAAAGRTKKASLKASASLRRLEVEAAFKWAWAAAAVAAQFSAAKVAAIMAEPEPRAVPVKARKASEQLANAAAQGAAFLTGAAAVEAMAMEAGVVAAAGMFVLGGAALASTRMMAKKAKSKATAAQEAKAAAAAQQEDEILALVSVEEVTVPAAAAPKTKKAAKKAKKQVDAAAAAASAVLSSSSA